MTAPRPTPQLHTARLFLRLDLADGPVLDSAAVEGARVKVEYLEYEIDLLTRSEDLWAHGRPTTGRRGTARNPNTIIRDETLAVIPDDLRDLWLADARTIAAGIPGIGTTEQGDTT